MKTPKVITDIKNLVGDASTGAPKASYGSQGDYAVNTTATTNKAYYKNKGNSWVQLGSGDSATQYGSWKTSHPTVEGTLASPTVVVGNTIVINEFEIAATGTTVTDLASDINAGGDASSQIPGVVAAVVSNKLALYATDLGTGEDSTASGQIKIANGKLNAS